jgi:hypothetical protein
MSLGRLNVEFGLPPGRELAVGSLLVGLGLAALALWGWAVWRVRRVTWMSLAPAVASLGFAMLATMAVSNIRFY